jgi:hypothetical protein
MMGRVVGVMSRRVTGGWVPVHARVCVQLGQDVAVELTVHARRLPHARMSESMTLPNDVVTTVLEWMGRPAR